MDKKRTPNQAWADMMAAWQLPDAEADRQKRWREMKPDWVKTKDMGNCWLAEGTTPDGIYHCSLNADCKTEADAIEDLLFSIREIRREQMEVE